jgi:alkanesulfonate monooxygenase SsuD/methylene tetrahydromethanopterin reductase-like flavin-dependent oxidoreductase (luciferase family)
MLLGTKDKVIDRISEYIDAGAEGLNIVVRAPFDWESIQVFQEDVISAFK